MKKDGKERLFEVMGRLDKTFKPKLNEGFEEIEASAEEVPAEEPVMDIETGEEEVSVEEKSPEEKLAELTTKVDELHALVHGEESEEEAPAEEVPAEPEAGEEEAEVEVGIENLEESELNEDHLKDRESQEAFICKNDKDCKKEDLKDLSDEDVKKKYNALEKKMGMDESEVPVAAVAKVGEAK